MRLRIFIKAARIGLSMLLAASMFATTGFAFGDISPLEELVPEDRSEEMEVTEYRLDMDLFLEKEASSYDSGDFSIDGIMLPNGNNSPDTAAYIPEGLMNTHLIHAATEDSDWYYFELTETNKLTIAYYPDEYSGQYAMSLHKLDPNTGVIAEVNDSSPDDPSHHIVHMDTAGYYFLNIHPVVPPARPYNYNFIIVPSYNYDSYEYNDYPEFAPSLGDSLDVTGNIDSPLDLDFYKLTMPTYRTVDITLSGSNHQQFEVYLYQYNGNSQNPYNEIGYLSAGNQVLTSHCMPGEYYLWVNPIGGVFSDADNYHLTVNGRTQPFSEN